MEPTTSQCEGGKQLCTSELANSKDVSFEPPSFFRRLETHPIPLPESGSGLMSQFSSLIRPWCSSSQSTAALPSSDLVTGSHKQRQRGDRAGHKTPAAFAVARNSACRKKMRVFATSGIQRRQVGELTTLLIGHEEKQHFSSPFLS